MDITTGNNWLKQIINTVYICLKSFLRIYKFLLTMIYRLNNKSHHTFYGVETYYNGYNGTIQYAFVTCDVYKYIPFRC